MRSFHRLPPILLVLALAACTPEPAPAPPAAEDADKAAQTAKALPADPLLAGTDGLTTRITGTVLVRTIGTKSFSRLNERLLLMRAAEIVAEAMRYSV